MNLKNGMICNLRWICNTGQILPKVWHHQLQDHQYLCQKKVTKVHWKEESFCTNRSAKVDSRWMQNGAERAPSLWAQSNQQCKHVIFISAIAAAQTPSSEKQLTLLINAEQFASNTNALLFHGMFVDLEASLSSFIQGFSLVKNEIEVIRFSLLPPSSAITLPTPAQPKTFLLENSFPQKSFTAPFFNTKWESTSLSNLTYRCSFSNYSIQLDGVAMFKLSHDGCLLQEFQTVLWREIIFQGLNGHWQQQNTRSIVLQQTWRRWSLKSITPMILKNKEEFAFNTRPNFS